jgi:hypothetical protein
MMTSMLSFASAADAKQQVVPAFSAFLAATSFSRPGGRRPWMAAVFGPRQDAESENPDAARTLVQAFCKLVLSLVTFFAPAKKVTRLQAKAFDFSSVKRRSRSNAFALTREFISFAGPLRRRRERRSRPEGRAPQVRVKETNQRKGPSPTRRNSDRKAGRDFRTRHPWLDPKTAGILPAALRVCLDPGLSAKEANAVIEGAR